jgi:hypothetical protein
VAGALVIAKTLAAPVMGIAIASGVDAIGSAYLAGTDAFVSALTGHAALVVLVALPVIVCRLFVFFAGPPWAVLALAHVVQTTGERLGGPKG